MPAYFKFLTVMAYYVFLKEKVDVAIVEVGIGGEYDCTNVIRYIFCSLVRILKNIETFFENDASIFHFYIAEIRKPSALRRSVWSILNCSVGHFVI